MTAKRTEPAGQHGTAGNGAAVSEAGPPDAEVARLAHDLRTACMRVSRRVRFESSDAVAPHQFSVLARLDDSPRTVGELAVIERVSAPSMSKTVAALSDAGLVRRSEDPHDGRLVRLSLTDEGAAVLARVRAERDAWMTARLEDLDAGDRALLRRATDLLNQVVRP